MTIILKNTTGSDIALSEFGVTVPLSGQYLCDTQEYTRLAGDDSITEITTHINTGDIVVNDGVDDITVANGFTLQNAIDYLKYPNTAFNIRFAAEPERSNGFTKKNTQEAIEESRTSGVGKLIGYFFAGSGNTFNKWLGFGNTNSTSDVVPLVLPQDMSLKGVTYSNANDDSSIDLEVHVNGVLSFTWQVRNYRVAWETGLSGYDFNQGDRISIYAKKVTGGGIINPATPEISIYFKLLDEVSTSNGIQFGV